MSFLQDTDHDKELSLYRDQRLTPEQTKQFEEHLSSCEACQGALQEADAWKLAMAGFPKATYSAQRTDRIMEALETRVEAEASEEISVWEWLLGPLRVMVPVTAAVAVCFLGLVLFSSPNSIESSSQPPASSVESTLFGQTSTSSERTLWEGLLSDDETR